MGGSWWDLGEHSGTSGNDLAIHEIQCAFCFEKGSFKVEHHAAKQKANSGKVLNFDTLKCSVCGGYVMVLWSRNSWPPLGPGSGMHAYRTLPWPQRVDTYPSHWPETVGRHWKQAFRSLLDENWDASAVMSRAAMQAALRDHGAAGKSLKQEVEDLAAKGILPPLMTEWSHEVRELGNDSAHPEADQPGTTAAAARDIFNYLDFMLEYLYNLPKQIADYRKRPT